jgi:hypothetical protein
MVIVFALLSGASVAVIQLLVPSCEDSQLPAAPQFPVVTADLKKSVATVTSATVMLLDVPVLELRGGVPGAP